MAGQSPLRRWKPFLSAFSLVDAAIEAANPALCRDEIRCARGDVVELLCGVPASAVGEAEKLCCLLDSFMAESLVTLQAVPAYAVPRVLASSADLTKAVCALMSHQSERVRGLASDVIRGWRSAAIEDDKARVTAKLDAVCRVKKAAEASRRPLPNAKRDSPEEKKMEATKRKLREGYREAEDSKRQRKIHVIQAPKMLEQRQRKMHSIMRERSLARCGRPLLSGAVSSRRLTGSKAL